jgi:flagellar hook-associated protein 2
VSASFDLTSDRLVLTNKSTGNIGLSVSEEAGGLLSALGLTNNTGGTFSAGLNAEYTVNGGDPLISTSNSFSPDSHGLTGLIVTATSTGSQTVTVGADTEKMKSAIQSFIDKFNALQSYIDEQTKITSTNGKVTTSTLTNNREVQSWAQAFRSAAFGAVTGLTGTISRLEQMGIDFTAGTSQLAIRDESKLNAALNDRPQDVEAFFSTNSVGFADRFKALFTSFTGIDGTGGLLKSQKDSLTKSNSSIEQQIADIDRRLVQRREQMEAAFIAMEQAQSRLQQMQTQLTNSFFKDNSKQ